VTLADGRQIKAKKAVIANVTPKALVDGLLDGRSGRAATMPARGPSATRRAR
jgi:hypothetical protein